MAAVDRPAVVAACVIATVAFSAYSQTLLPGVDLGDTGGFQAAVLWPETTARQGYPLYYSLARPFVDAVSATNPARGLNLFSALWAAVAVGLLVFVAGAITRSVVSGAVAGLFLAFSYTFWTQAVIAEVYSLHLALIGACLVTLNAYAARPTRALLALFFAVYALSFGNHLSMILLLGPFAVFLVQVSRPRFELFRPAVVGLAITFAALGALQYAPNFMSVWTGIDVAGGWHDRLATFWFDTTKADWRELSVLGVEASGARDRIAMWWWDAQQQFGLIGLAIAAIGAVRLWWISRAWATLVWLAFMTSTLFALTYNVGDTHVFLLPGHFWTAFAAGAAFAGLRSDLGSTSGSPDERRPAPTAYRILALASLCGVAAYIGWRAWITWPAADRHLDRRGAELVTRLTFGVSDDRALLVSQLDWQSENALLYTSRVERQDLTWVRLADVFPHFPFLVRDNQEIGRDVILTAAAAADVAAAYGPALPMVVDEALPAPSVTEQIALVPPGARYVLCLLTPPQDQQLDRSEVGRALSLLTGDHVPDRNESAYEVVAGVKGQPPEFHRSSNHPFTAHASIGSDIFSIRMDSWLPSDTFRRGGFGHVLRGRERVLFIERGLSLVWIAADGASSYAYAAGLYAPQPRFRIPGRVAQLAHNR